MSEHPPQNNTLRIALILPQERAFYSDGTGKPRLFRGAPEVIRRGLSTELEPISHETLSDRILRNPAYGFQPTKPDKALPVFDGIRSFVRKPVVKEELFKKGVNPGETVLYEFEKVAKDAERNRNLIDPIDLRILAMAFENQIRRRR